MEWLLAGALIVSLFAILLYRNRIKNLLAENEITAWRADQTRAADNALVIAVLAREIANELMERDAENYKNKFERLYYKWRDITKNDDRTKRSHAETITAKYVSFLDFDELSTKAHVLYADGFSWKSDDDLWELYESIRLYDALSCELDEAWRLHGTSIDEKEYEHLKQYCKKLSDTKLLAHLYNAREELDLLRINEVEENLDREWQYETNRYKFRRVADFVESRWGVYVKDLDRYGMWGLFVDDNNKAYTSFYAADKNFNEEILDDLAIRQGIDVKYHRRIETIQY